MELSDRVIEIFKAIAQVPRQSKHEAKISAWLADRAKSSGFEVERDDANNVIIRVPATKGYENAPIIALQGHMDMVCEKTPTSTHNFDTDPIEVIIEGDWMHANQTTLGADDGLGVALALAMAEDPNVEHPRLEIIITSDEETGMTGAIALKPESVQARILLNLDSEDEGIFTVGCAGGRETTSTLDLSRAPLVAGSRKVDIHVTGLLGGHSGCDIHLQRANANKLLFRFLKEAVSNYEARLACVQGGSLRNAIPREAEAVITIPADAYDDVMALVDDYETLFVTEYEGIEDAISLTAEQIDCPKTEEVQDYLIHAITICPHGVYRMMTEMPDIVETSNNLAMIEFSQEGEENVIEVQCLTRSSVESRKRELREIIHSAFSIAGADVAFSGDYPGWKPNINSRIMHTMKAIYEREFGAEPRIVIIHAGLECGIIGRNYPGMDMISFGPTIEHPHSPDERVNIATVQKFYDFLLATLKEL